jgi:Flp pilus assembly protein TadG
MSRLATRTSGSLLRLRRNDDGVAATEFSLVAPILFFCCLATVDVGMALNERMTIDHVLRAGAQSAMTNPGEAKVRDVMEETAKGSNFTVNVVSSTDNAHATASTESLTIAVERYHACPDNPDAKVPANSCAGPDPSTYTYYRMTAAKIYEAMILPNITFAPAMTVQVR